MKTTVRQSLQQVADYPQPLDDNWLDIKAHELVARSLYEIANNPDGSVRGSMARANKARKMIMDRLVGRRRPGTHPATREQVAVEFVDLTTHALPTGEDDEQGTGEGSEVPDSDPGRSPDES